MRLNLLGSMLSGGVSYYREAGPATLMAKLDPSLSLYRREAHTWVDFVDTDWVMANGCYTAAQVDALTDAKFMGAKIWIDYDDAVGNVDWHSPRAQHFDPPTCQANIQKVVSLADLVTVSTPQVAEAINYSAAHVIPNAWDNRMLRMVEEPSRNKTVLWRGSDTHVADLATFDYELEHLASEHRDWKFVYVGQMPPFQMRRNLPNVERIGSLQLLQFFQKIVELNPSVMIVPMTDTLFNRARSNIAWMEGTCAGAACVVPDWPAWQVDAVKYQTATEFYEFTDNLIRSPDLRESLWRKSAAYITNELPLEKWAKKRIGLLNG